MILKTIQQLYTQQQEELLFFGIKSFITQMINIRLQQPVHQLFHIREVQEIMKILLSVM